MPRLQAKPHCRPQLLHFPPYSRQELAAIVQDRLRQVRRYITDRVRSFEIGVLFVIWFVKNYRNAFTPPFYCLTFHLFLFQVSGEGVLDAAAVQFCARKVSAVSGDARKALDICRYDRSAEFFLIKILFFSFLLNVGMHL